MPFLVSGVVGERRGARDIVDPLPYWVCTSALKWMLLLSYVACVGIDWVGELKKKEEKQEGGGREKKPGILGPLLPRKFELWS